MCTLKFDSQARYFIVVLSTLIGLPYVYLFSVLGLKYNLKEDKLVDFATFYLQIVR